MKSVLLLVGSWLVCVSAIAQTRAVEHLSVEARGDYQRDYVDGSGRDDASGFSGRYLNVKMNGQIADRLTYSYRQRLNKASLDAGFFDATDWLHLDYQPTDQWTLSAGKQVVDIGGYEYDRAPIDLYFCSEFWNNVPCYAWGASVAYQLTATDKLRFQVCESPYRQLPSFSHEDLYSYNLMWYGSHGPWSTMWSVNMMERTDGHYISYIALGNELRLSDRLRLELDLMNRAADHQTFFLRDCSVIGELSYRPTTKWNIYAKASYDVNRTHTAADQLVMAGTELTRVGGGLEFFPLGDSRVRLHANYCYSFGTNANPAGTMLDRQSLVDVGLTWRVRVIGE